VYASKVFATLMTDIGGPPVGALSKRIAQTPTKRLTILGDATGGRQATASCRVKPPKGQDASTQATTRRARRTIWIGKPPPTQQRRREHRDQARRGARRLDRRGAVGGKADQVLPSCRSRC
jgi:hypothetical protein